MNNMANNFKSAFITIIGRPNVGKSTLLNCLVGQKISIVTNKPQTTRNSIRGILTKKDQYQMIFIDTPGIHLAKNTLGKKMNSFALKSLKDIDIALILLPVDEIIGNNDNFILNEVKKIDIPKILVITKIDKVSKQELLNKMASLKPFENVFNDIIPISSAEDINIEQLKEVIYKNMVKYDTNDYCFFENDQITDQSIKFRIKEIIRENILFKTGQEVPHFVGIMIDKFAETDDKVEIYVSIIVEKQTQKSILIGKEGKKISDIKYKSKKEIKNLLNKEVKLDLFVKVVKDWTKSDAMIKKILAEKENY